MSYESVQEMFSRMAGECGAETAIERGGRRVSYEELERESNRLANFLLAIAIYACLFMILGKPSTSPRVDAVQPGSAADTAGFKPGDLVLTINGRSTEGLGNGALDYLAAGKLNEPLVVTIQPRTGGAPREVKLDRVPVDYDPSRPAVAGNPPKR